MITAIVVKEDMPRLEEDADSDGTFEAEEEEEETEDELIFSGRPDRTNTGFVCRWTGPHTRQT